MPVAGLCMQKNNFNHSYEIKPMGITFVLVAEIAKITSFLILWFQGKGFLKNY